MAALLQPVQLRPARKCICFALHCSWSGATQLVLQGQLQRMTDALCGVAGAYAGAHCEACGGAHAGDCGGGHAVDCGGAHAGALLHPVLCRQGGRYAVMVSCAWAAPVWRVRFKLLSPHSPVHALDPAPAQASVVSDRGSGVVLLGAEQGPGAWY